MERALREDERQPEGVVEMAVADEDVGGAAELQRPAPDVDRQPGRMDAEPGLVAGPRPPLEAEPRELELDRPHGAVRAAQISRYSQRRKGASRCATLSQSGSISQSAAAIEESSELPSWGVKQKP